MHSCQQRDLADITVCIVPVFNEGIVLEEVLLGLTRLFPHVICVDDGSVDDSAKISAKLGLQTVSHALNVGQGAALITGLKLAARNKQFVYAITFDADGQHSPEDAMRLVQKLDETSVGIVFGTRFIGDGSGSIPLVKRLLLRTVVLVRQLCGRSQLTDSHNGLRALRLSAFEDLEFVNYGMAHASEIVAWVLKNDIKYAEAPVSIMYSRYSRRKGQSIWNAVNILIDLILR